MERLPFKTKLESTRFILTGWVILSASIYVPLHLITGAEWLAAVTLALGFYHGVKGIEAVKGLSAAGNLSFKDKLESTKFLLVSFVIVSATIYIPLHLIVGSEWLAANTLALGFYHGIKGIEAARGNSQG
jgi:hypothetical protein